MQCGPIRHTAARPADALHDLEVLPRSRVARIDLPPESGFRRCFGTSPMIGRGQRQSPQKSGRRSSGPQGAVLTERTEHLDAIQVALVQRPRYCSFFTADVQEATRHAHRRARRAATRCARILLATGNSSAKDRPSPLDTWSAMPVSWKGTLQQYAGRLHRSTPPRLTCGSSTSWIPVTRHCFECGTKRQRGYVRWATRFAQMRALKDLSRPNFRSIERF